MLSLSISMKRGRLNDWKRKGVDDWGQGRASQNPAFDFSYSRVYVIEPASLVLEEGNASLLMASSCAFCKRDRVLFSFYSLGQVFSTDMTLFFWSRVRKSLEQGKKGREKEKFVSLFVLLLHPRPRVQRRRKPIPLALCFYDLRHTLNQNHTRAANESGASNNVNLNSNPQLLLQFFSPRLPFSNSTSRCRWIEA